MIERISNKSLWIISGDVILRIANKQLSLFKDQAFSTPPPPNSPSPGLTC